MHHAEQRPDNHRIGARVNANADDVDESLDGIVVKRLFTI